MAKVILENITKQFGDVTAVNKVNLEIDDGEFMVLVGPSGCGKTTLLRMVAGLEKLSGGDITIGNRIVNHLPPKSRDIAMVFQSYALYPHMNVFENMAFALRLRKFSKDEIKKRVNEAAEILDIQKLLTRKPKQLSGGQRQRVALGRAMVRQPAVFLFDEPLSNLDAKLRVQMRAELSKLHSQLKTTSLYVTHDQVEAMTMGSKIAIIKEGVLQQTGTPLDIYNHPRNKFVAGFIGSPPMNFFDAQIKKEDGKLHVRAEGIDIPLSKSVETKLNALDNAGQDGFVIGIRPDHMHDAELSAQIKEKDTAPIQAVVDVVEPMGNETYVHAHYGAGKLVAKVSPYTKAAYGKNMTLLIEADKLLVFDKKSSLNLTISS